MSRMDDDSRNLKENKKNTPDRDSRREAETVIGYVFDDDGRYREKWWFKGTTENLASFIMNNKNHEVMITDSFDLPVASSLRGGFLDRVREDLLDELRKEIIPMQMGERKPTQMDFVEDGSSRVQKELWEEFNK